MVGFIYIAVLECLQIGYPVIDGSNLTLKLFRAASLGAFILGAVYFLASLSKACLHEATVLLNRRHALRFGRLYVYANNGMVTFEEMDKAFKWNTDFPTAFKEIQTEAIPKTLWHKVLETFPEMIKAAVPKKDIEKWSSSGNRNRKSVE